MGSLIAVAVQIHLKVTGKEKSRFKRKIAVKWKSFKVTRYKRIILDDMCHWEAAINTLK